MLVFATNFGSAAHPPSPISVKFICNLRTMLRRDWAGII